MDWHNIQELFQNLVERFKPDVVGALGAIISAWYGRAELAGKMDFAVYVIAGLANVHFLTGPAMYWLNIPASHAPAVGFVIGMFGGSLFAAIRRMFANADLWALIKSRFGGRDGGES